MPSYCAAYACHSTNDRDEVAFHKSPRDQKTAAKRAAGVKKKILRTYEMRLAVAVTNFLNFEAAAALLFFPHLHAVHA